MTEEVTDAITAYLKAFDEGTGTVYVEPLMRLAMRSASNSPTTNGEVTRVPAAPDDVERFMRAICDQQRRGVEGLTFTYGQVERGIRAALSVIPIPATGEVEK